MRRSCASEDWPVPKSSIDTPMRWAASASRTPQQRTGSIMTAFSVTSTTSRSPGMPWRESAATIRAGRPVSISVVADTLTATRASWPARRQTPAAASASSTIQPVRRPRPPIRSAGGRSSAGAIAP
jgi:hypothetical protein